MGFGPSLCYCGDEAEATLVYIWDDDGTEVSRTRPLCHPHYWQALDIWAGIEENDPGAVEGLVITVASPQGGIA